MTLHVGYVVKRFPRSSETFIAQEILELERQGVKVSVFTLWPNDSAAEHGWLGEIEAEVVHCGDLPLSEAWKWLHRRRPEAQGGAERAVLEAFAYPDRRGRHRLKESVAVAAAALERGVGHLHAHFANDPAFVAYLGHLASGLPFSFTAHAKDLYAKALPAPLLERIVLRSSFSVTVSEDNRRHLQGVLSERASRRILMLHNGVDLTRLSPPQAGPDGHSVVSISCIARLIEKKGIDTLLEGLSLLTRRGVETRAVIVGDGPLRDELEQQADEAGLGERVTFTGLLPHEDALAHVGSSDLFVLPARVARSGDQDALPTVLLEAMALGRPCISTPVGGIAEIVVPSETGLIVPSDRPLALAEAISELAENPHLRGQMGAAGRRRTEELFDLSTNVGRLAEWFSASRAERPIAAQPLRVVEA